jgi:sulfur relay (sulfurtransferase) complex TusBCD TusD component (DsrE family)
MKFGMLLTTSGENQNSEVLIKLAMAAIEAGHEIELFFMDDGVYNVMTGNKISRRFAELIAKGASLSLCGHTAEVRGVEKEGCVEGVSFAGQYELACMVNETDRFVMFGG